MWPGANYFQQKLTIYIPMNIDGLRDCLLDVPVTGDTLKDMHAAMNFIERYLYNQDGVTAETMISYELKAKFRLKATDIKPLLAYYRECAKDYQSKIDYKLLTADESTPDWYEPTKNGLRFFSGVLAESLAKSAGLIYAAEQYYLYHAGVYSDVSDLYVQRLVQEKMLAAETKTNQITDTEHQLRLLVLKELREINANPYIINKHEAAVFRR